MLLRIVRQLKQHETDWKFARGGIHMYVKSNLCDPTEMKHYHRYLSQGLSEDEPGVSGIMPCLFDCLQ